MTDLNIHVFFTIYEGQQRACLGVMHEGLETYHNLGSAFFQKLSIWNSFKNLANHLKWFLDNHLLCGSSKNHFYVTYYQKHYQMPVLVYI